jgi:hypothetical protein
MLLLAALQKLALPASETVEDLPIGVNRRRYLCRV